MRILIPLLLIVLSGCGEFIISDKAGSELKRLKVTIAIEDNDEEVNKPDITVNLSNGKRGIRNENIKIIVNEQPLELVVETYMVYMKQSYYFSDSLKRQDDYYFEIILPDSSRHALGYIRPKPFKDRASFEIPDRLDVERDFIFSWQNMTNRHNLDIIKGIDKLNTETNYSESGYDGRILDTIQAKEGQYVIPESYFKDSSYNVSFLEIAIQSQEYGLMNPALMRKSELVLQYEQEEVIRVESME